jgi:hypothetical protein
MQSPANRNLSRATGNFRGDVILSRGGKGRGSRRAIPASQRVPGIMEMSIESPSPASGFFPAPTASGHRKPRPSRDSTPPLSKSAASKRSFYIRSAIYGPVHAKRCPRFGVVIVLGIVAKTVTRKTPLILLQPIDWIRT